VLGALSGLRERPSRGLTIVDPLSRIKVSDYFVKGEIKIE
jgi:hypothetical protein